MLEDGPKASGRLSSKFVSEVLLCFGEIELMDQEKLVPTAMLELASANGLIISDAELRLYPRTAHWFAQASATIRLSGRFYRLIALNDSLLR